MVRRHAVARLNLERLETRWLLAIERPFVEHVWEATLGDVATVALVADLDGDGIDDIVATSSSTSSKFDAANNAWYKLQAASNRFILAGVLPSRNSDTQYVPNPGITCINKLASAWKSPLAAKCDRSPLGVGENRIQHRGTRAGGVAAQEQIVLASDRLVSLSARELASGFGKIVGVWVSDAS